MSVHTFKIKEKIRNNEHFSDDEKQALLNALRGDFLEVYSPDFVKKLMERFAEADDRQPVATKDELKDEIAKLATKDELKAEIAKLATKDELKAEIAVARADILKWMFGSLLAQTALIVGLIVGLVKLL